MRSRRTPWPPIAVSIPLVGIIVITWLETWDVRFQAGIQRGCTATLDRFRQIAPRVGTCQFATSISFILACQVACIGQQLIDLAVAKDPLGRNGGTVGCGALEGSLVERTHRLDILTLAIAAQGKLRCQLLRSRESRAVPRVAITGMGIVSGLGICVLGVVCVLIYVRCDSSVCRASHGVDQVLPSRCGGEHCRRSSNKDNADQRSRHELSS